MVEHKGELISLVSTLPNVFFQDLMRQKKLPIFKGYRIMKNEVVVKNHRIDFLLSDSKDNLFLEIKSVTFSKKKVAQFPDAITERGKKHILLLTDMVKKDVMLVSWLFANGQMWRCLNQNGIGIPSFVKR